MTDFFELFGFERKAVLDADAVRGRFQELSRDLHPDAEGGDAEKFAELNEGQSVLSRPAGRLRHLVEREYGPDAVKAMKDGTMTGELMDLFVAIGKALTEADTFIARKTKAQCALAKALLAGEEGEIQSALMQAGGKLMAFRRAAEKRLEEVDRWVAAGLHESEQFAGAVYRDLAFAEKWQLQVQERMGAMV